MNRSLDSHMQLLLENHLAFLGSHRGQVTAEGGSFAVTSERAAFTFVIAGSSPRVLGYAETFTKIHLGPWAESQKEALSKLGWTRQGSISYMELAQSNPSRTSSNDIQIKRVQSAEEMHDFCEIQGRAFFETKEDFEFWHPWLSAANFKNLSSQNQHFLVGYRGKGPVGVALLLIKDNVAGIYAVATPPEFRKTGVSTAILNEAIAQAHRSNCSLITLQVNHGSYAQSLYTKLGFRSVFELDVFTAPDSKGDQESRL